VYQEDIFMTTQNIHGGLTLVQVAKTTAKMSDLWLVKRGETILGMLEKYKNTKSCYHPWKAWAGYGLTARFLGAFYEPHKDWLPADTMNMGGKNGAIDAIVQADRERQSRIARDGQDERDVSNEILDRHRNA
jgi:hypothetical protein